MGEPLSVNPMVQFHKQLKQKRKERRLENASNRRKYENMKAEKEAEKLQKIQKDEDPVIVEAPPVEIVQDQKDEQIRVPGYSQVFSKKQIDMNRQFVDPNRAKYNDPQQQSGYRRVEQQESSLEYKAKPNEKIYKNNEGVVITEEVLKMFGPGFDPSKIKIGVRQKQQQIRQETYDPFSKVVEQMNFDYIKDLEQQKNPQPKAPPMPVEPEVKKKIFLPDEKIEKPVPKPDQDVFIGESTVKKSKIDLTKQSYTFLPTQLLKPQVQQAKPIVVQSKQAVNPNQDKFRDLLVKDKVPQDQKSALDQFFKEIERL